MFFFFYDDTGVLQDNVIIQKAFEKVMFLKLQHEGYCDINPLIGKPKLSKDEIEGYLRKIKSPLSQLYKKKYANNNEELQLFLLPVINEFASFYAEEEYETDVYNYFAIVYYIFQVYKSDRSKLEYITELYKRWNDQEEKCDIIISNGIVYDASRVDLQSVSSVKQYLDLIEGINCSTSDETLFFRGHSRVNFELLPSLFRRKRWLQNEKKMCLELYTRCPDSFEKMNFRIEKLSLMQHYGLPTRMLDITQNPLVALYFACSRQMSYRGEVVIFSEKNDKVKYNQSDMVSILATLPLFTFNVQTLFYNCSTDSSKDASEYRELERLVHEVGMERPGFKMKLQPEDLQRAVVYIPPQNNRRIINQESAFIVCGLLNEVYGNFGGKKHRENALSSLRLKNKDGKIVVCILENKKNLMNELETLGINRSKIYPEIDDVAEFIKMQY